MNVSSPEASDSLHRNVDGTVRVNAMHNQNGIWVAQYIAIYPLKLVVM